MRAGANFSLSASFLVATRQLHDVFEALSADMKKAAEQEGLSVAAAASAAGSGAAPSPARTVVPSPNKARQPTAPSLPMTPAMVETLEQLLEGLEQQPDVMPFVKPLQYATAEERQRCDENIPDLPTVRRQLRSGAFHSVGDFASATAAVFLSPLEHCRSTDYRHILAER